MLSQILGDTPSGRLHKQLTETKLASSAFAFAWSLADPSVMFLGAQLAPGQDVDKARAALLAPWAACSRSRPRLASRAAHTARRAPRDARVALEGTNLEAATRSDGSFTLAPLPAGTARLRVFFTGLAPQVLAVEVPAGATVRRDITLAPAGGRAGETVRLEAFAVAASREMDAAALAINEQRFASNLRTVVSTDEFGTVAEGHVGEFMKFLPGVTMEYAGGNAREISINGAPADNVPISMGGFDMASAAGAGTRRAVELDQISINNISRIEINRSPTPDTPGSALAGSVNFVPRSAFERNKDGNAVCHFSPPAATASRSVQRGAGCDRRRCARREEA